LDVNNDAGSDLVVAKEEERSALTVQQTPQLVSSKWTKRSQQLSSSKNGNFVHATKKQKQHYPYKDFMPRPSSFMNVDPPTRFVHHQNSFVFNQIEKFQKIVEYASHRLQDKTLGLQEEPSVIKHNKVRGEGEGWNDD